MKVGELIEKLKSFDQERKVILEFRLLHGPYLIVFTTVNVVEPVQRDVFDLKEADSGEIVIGAPQDKHLFDLIGERKRIITKKEEKSENRNH